MRLALALPIALLLVGCGDGSDDPSLPIPTATPESHVIVEEICQLFGPLTPTVCVTPQPFPTRKPRS